MRLISFSKKSKPISEFNYVIPSIQRSIDDEHCDKLYLYLKGMYDSSGLYPIAGCISIALCGETEYLIDGQHRMATYRRLMREFPDRKLEVLIDYYEVSGIDDVDTLFKIVNTHKTVSITKMDLDPYKIINEVQKYFLTNFKQYMSTSERPHRPNISMARMETYIIDNDILRRGNITTGADFISRIKGLNQYYATVSAQQYEKWGIKGADQVLRKIAQHPTNLYFGLYSNFEWLERICDSHNSGDLDCVNSIRYPKQASQQHYCSTYRAPICKALRMKVWNSPLVAGKCYCCEADITITTFECGHVIPLALGGETNCVNLKAICRQCNQDMGMRNMEEYKARMMEQMR